MESESTAAGAIARRAAPHDQELARRQADLARIERELAASEAAWKAYADQLFAFQRRYLQAFGATFAELEELDAQIAERAAQVRPADNAKQRKAERARARLTPFAGGGGEAPVAPKPSPTDELRAIFRALTKRIHPDLADDEAERQRREALMVEANAAYAAGDVAALAYLSARQEPAAAEDALDRLTRRIALAQAQLARAEARRAASEASDLARLMRRETKAKDDGRDLFRKLAGELEEELKHARKRLRALTRRAEKREG